MPLLPAVRRATLGTLAATGRRTISPTHGWGKQSVWLAASGSRTPCCGRKPRPTLRPEAEWQREENRFCDCQDCDTVDKEMLPWTKQGEDKHDYNPCLAV